MGGLWSFVVVSGSPRELVWEGEGGLKLFLIASTSQMTQAWMKIRFEVIS